MIDEKKIEEAAKEYASKRDIFLKCGCHIGFMAGINWFLDNIWHEASEEPKKGLLLVEYNGDMMYLFSLIHTKNYKYPNSGVKRWFYLDDLLKGGK